MKIQADFAKEAFRPVTITVECYTAAELAAFLCHANVSVSDVVKSVPDGLKVQADEVERAVQKLVDPLWEAVSTAARSAGIYGS